MQMQMNLLFFYVNDFLKALDKCYYCMTVSVNFKISLSRSSVLIIITSDKVLKYNSFSVKLLTKCQ